MNKRSLIGVYIAVVTTAIILGLILSGILLELYRGAPFPFPVPPEYLPVFAFMMTLKTVVSFVNIGLILLMLGIYIDHYRKIKTNFTAGLLLLILVLLMNALTSNPLLFLRFEGPVISQGIGFIIPDLFSTIALSVLFYLSLE